MTNNEHHLFYQDIANRYYGQSYEVRNSHREAHLINKGNYYQMLAQSYKGTHNDPLRPNKLN